MVGMPIVPPATVLVTLGATVAIMSIPLWLGLVGPNRFYGIRIPAAFASEQNWYLINRFGGLRFLGFAAVVAIMGFLLGRYEPAPFWLPILCLLATLPLVLLTVHSIKRFAATLSS